MSKPAFTFTTPNYVTTDQWVTLATPVTVYGQTFTRVRYATG